MQQTVRRERRGGTPPRNSARSLRSLPRVKPVVPYREHQARGGGKEGGRDGWGGVPAVEGRGEALEPDPERVLQRGKDLGSERGLETPPPDRFVPQQQAKQRPVELRLCCRADPAARAAVGAQTDSTVREVERPELCVVVTVDLELHTRVPERQRTIALVTVGADHAPFC